MRQFRRQRLQRDLDPGRLVETPVDHSHAALPELRQHLVASEDQIAYFKTAVRFSLAAAGHGHIG